jgi:hypothetical protein
MNPLYTYADLVSLEGTVEKLVSVANMLTTANSVDRKNAQALQHIISNLRNSSDLWRSDLPATQEAGTERLLSLFK